MTTAENIPTPTLPPDLYSLDNRIVFFPVRHHSPACARLVKETIDLIQPAAILIEGPADFNEQIHEMALPHQMPIAIYSYVKLENGMRRGAFYPFCVYSPEWQAVKTANDRKIPVKFVDLPWFVMADPEAVIHRYSDGDLRQSPYIPQLCRDVGVETFDDLWDTLFEIGDLTPAEYLKRGHYFCTGLRYESPQVREVDLKREEYMAAMIQQFMQEVNGRVLVITGGFHSIALFERLQADCPMPQLPEPPEERGIALTPYSYERLDNLRGYESGMPNPGFYHHVYNKGDYEGLLTMVAKTLREKGQIVSTADYIAVETSALSLATLRGHDRVWRRDLIDGVITALVKDELAFDMRHPFLEAIHEVFRGKDRGRLAQGATLPPLVVQLQEQLSNYGLEPEQQKREVRLDLFKPDDLTRSRILHQVRVLRLPGYQLESASDITDERIEESWTIVWGPEFEGACIEASIYGATLDDAARARLYEEALEMKQPDAGKAAGILLDAALMGLPEDQDLYQRLADVIVQDGNFITVAQALSRLLYLYRFDAVLGTARNTDVGGLLRTCFRRSLLLLETLGVVKGQDKELVQGVQAVQESFERCNDLLDVDRADFGGVFQRIANDKAQLPLMRGAGTGVLWTLGGFTINLQAFAQPEDLGDFLTGLFALAREVIQRDTSLINEIDGLLMGYDEEGFLTALPALRLAFSFFVPREKYYITRTLFGKDAADLPPLQVDIQQATRVLAFEDMLFKQLTKFGIKVDPDPTDTATPEQPS